MQVNFELKDAGLKKPHLELVDQRNIMAIFAHSRPYLLCSIWCRIL